MHAHTIFEDEGNIKKPGVGLVLTSLADLKLLLSFTYSKLDLLFMF